MKKYIIKRFTKYLAQVNTLICVIHYFIYILLLFMNIPKYKTLSLTLRDLAHKNLEETLVASHWVFPNHSLRTTGQTTVM